MLKFKCDRCGKEMQRDKAWAIVLAPGAYAAEGAKKRTQGEICGDCAEILLKEMIYMEAHAGDCHDQCAHWYRNDMKNSACDGEVPAQARQGCRELHGFDGSACDGEVPAQARQGCRALQGSDGGACDGEVPAQARQGCSALQGYAGGACDGEVPAQARQGCRALQGSAGGACDGEVPAGDCHGAARLAMTKGKERNAEGRCITVARVRMGMSQKQLADLIYVAKTTVAAYESGIVQKIPWDELYRVMPELEEIRRNGCKAYCEDPTACLGGGKCHYARRW